MPGATSSTADELLLDLPEYQTKDGFVNLACRFSDQDEQRFILINDVTCYSYHLDDRVTESFVWISIREAHHASLPEIAAATGLKLRTLQHWRSKFVAHRYEGLIPNPGRPRIPVETREKALILLQKGQSRAWVTYQLKISLSSLERIVAENGPLVIEQSLPLEDDDASGESVTTIDSKPSPGSESLEEKIDIDKTPSPIVHSGPHRDPQDRSYDRALAKAGLLADAPPVFPNTERSEAAGWLMALVLLEQTDVLSIFDKTYGKTLGPAFYGLRTTVVTIVMMLALRIKRPEHLRRYNPAALGEALGLDRIMEVKTLRRKFLQLADLNRGIELMEALGQERVERHSAQQPGSELGLDAVFFDGHVKCYCGKFKLGGTWSATKNRVVKGDTKTWIHLPGQLPLFYIESPFNEGLIKAIEANLEKLEAACGGRPVLVFDREAWDTAFLKRLDDLGWKFITYRKGTYKSLPLTDFEPVETQIGKRVYRHAPVDQGSVPYNLYESVPKEDGASSRKHIGTIYFREVRILSDDSSHQTAVVTNLTKAAADSITVPATQFSRWGNQENVFKYMIAEYGLDDLLEYNRSEGKGANRSAEEDIPDEIDHPNPAYTKLTRQVSKVTSKRTKLLARYGLELESRISSAVGESAVIEPEELATLIKKISSSKEAEKLRHLNQQVIDLQAERAKHPAREKVAPAGYKQLRRGVSQIADSLKMVAFDLDNQLYDMLGKHYSSQAKDGRQLIAAAMRTAGSLKVESGKLVVRLEAQSSPHRTAAIDRVCEELNRLGSVYPGTELKIVFETPRAQAKRNK